MNKIFIIKVLTSRDNYTELKMREGHIQEIFLTEIIREWLGISQENVIRSVVERKRMYITGVSFQAGRRMQRPVV